MPQPIRLWGADVHMPTKTESKVALNQLPLWACILDFKHLTAAIAAPSAETAL